MEPALLVDGICIKSVLSSSWPSEYFLFSWDEEEKFREFENM